jgi:hypothetical protein
MWLRWVTVPCAAVLRCRATRRRWPPRLSPTTPQCTRSSCIVGSFFPTSRRRHVVHALPRAREPIASPLPLFKYEKYIIFRFNYSHQWVAEGANYAPRPHQALVGLCRPTIWHFSRRRSARRLGRARLGIMLYPSVEVKLIIPLSLPWIPSAIAHLRFVKDVAGEVLMCWRPSWCATAPSPRTWPRFLDPFPASTNGTTDCGVGPFCSIAITTDTLALRLTGTASPP